MNAPNLAGSVHGHFALNEVSSEPSLEKLTCARTMSASSLLDKVMAKEKTRGEELSALGKQTMAHAYSAMDYYFDHLKKTVASAPSGGTEFGEKVKACAEQNITATQEFVRDLSYAKDIQDMFRIQMGFMRTQMEAFGEQANSLGEAYIKAVSGQMRKPSPPDK